jgi:alpha-tubulin suppressor-like RCC1 family protein
VLGGSGGGFLSGVSAVSTGRSHALAVKDDGTAWAWGGNADGQLGDGTTSDSSTPVQVRGPAGSGPLAGLTKVSAGGDYSVALKNDGTVWAWGTGYLGNGSGYTTSAIPVQVKGAGGTGNLTGVAGISAGVAHTMALKADGTVWAWGAGSLGSGGSSAVPVQVKGFGGVGYLTGVVAVAAGDHRSVALRGDGSVWEWGTYGNPYPVPVAGPGGVGFLTGVVSIATKRDHTLAL